MPARWVVGLGDGGIWHTLVGPWSGVTLEASNRGRILAGGEGDEYLLLFYRFTKFGALPKGAGS